MRVNFVTPLGATEKSRQTPAYRHRMERVGKYLGDYVISILPVEADIHVFSKPYTEDLRVINALMAMSSTVPYVFDVCDDLFWRNNKVSDYMRIMCQDAVTITTAAESLVPIIKKETGRDAICIQDILEYEQQPIKIIDKPKYVWYGTHMNLFMLDGYKVPYIEIVCDYNDKVHAFLKKQDYPFVFTEWSPENQKKAMERNNVLFIPGNDHPHKLGKSANRVAEAINAGLSVVAYPIPAYRQFDKWITHSLDEPIKQLVPEAQEYVKNTFHASVIGEQWRQILSNSISAAAAA